MLALEEGRQEGRQEGQYRIVQRLLERRWGKLSPQVEQRLQALISQQLELLAEALLDFRSQADLETWLSDRWGCRAWPLADWGIRSETASLDQPMKLARAGDGLGDCVL